MSTRRGLVFGLLLCLNLTAQSPPGTFTPAEAQALDRIALAELKASRAPGMVLAVVRQDGTAYLKGYGTANVETGEAMAPEMLVSVASVSKVVVAATAAALAAEGKLDLDAPLKAKLPGLPEGLGRLTLAQLLSHTAGLSSRAYAGPAPRSDGHLGAIAKAFKAEFLSEPGARWAYSNVGYILAGCVLEEAAEASFPAAVNRTLFQPLAMQRSTFQPALAMTFPLAQGHDTRGEKPKIVRPYGVGPAPPGGLGTTVGDLARLARALLADGMLDGKQVLPKGILERMTKARGHGGALLGGERDYGLGLFLRDHRGLRIAEHEGLGGGWGASFALVPGRGLAAIAVCNGRFTAPCRTTQAALEIAAGLEPGPTQPTYVPIPAPEAARLAGRYSDGAGDELELRVVDGKLGAWEKGKLYPVVARREGHFEIQGYPSLLPLPATPLELVEKDTANPQTLIRVMWGLMQRVVP